MRVLGRQDKQHGFASIRTLRSQEATTQEEGGASTVVRQGKLPPAMPTSHVGPALCPGCCTSDQLPANGLEKAADGPRETRTELLAQGWPSSGHCGFQGESTSR